MDIRLPNLGEGADAAIVTSILVRAGDTVEIDQPLVELESEKAVASLPSTAAGRITHIHVAEGDEIRTGSLIVSLNAEATPGAPAAAPEELPAEPSAAETSSHADPTRSAGGGSEQFETAGHPPVASPSIRRIVRELGIDLSRVRPTGHGGRVLISDLREYIGSLQGQQTPATSRVSAAESIDFSRWGPVTVEKASLIRRTIARRMAESWATVPHVTQFVDADITDLMALREKYVSQYRELSARLTLTPIILKGVAMVLKQHPMLNSSLDEVSGSIIVKQYCHVGVAVDTDHGLIVPVIRDVDQKSILQLAKEVEDVGERARGRKISVEEMQGGSFTVSNQGGIGGGHFTPIINKPEVAILGVGRGAAGTNLLEGKVESRTLLPLSLSHDHRVIDGAVGVRFLVDLAKKLEDYPEAELELN